MPAFDTLQVAKELEVAFTPEQAEALVKAFAHTLIEDLATKRDVSDSEVALRHDIERLETTLRSELSALETKIDMNMKALEAKVDTNIKALEAKIDTNIKALDTKIDANTKMLDAKISTEIAAAKGEMIKWMVGAIAFNLLGTAGLMITLIKSIPH